MREILNHADDKSLILIDEFGAGTEPAAGGAIAEALLEQWEQRGAYGVITTHYTNLKFFATTSKGVLNGAMQFDVQHIRPLFKLETGVPEIRSLLNWRAKWDCPGSLSAKHRKKQGQVLLKLKDISATLPGIAVNGKKKWPGSNRRTRHSKT